MTKLLAIDPGELVGWATGHVDSEGALVLDNHGINGLKPFAIKLGESIGNYDLVIYETFRLAATHAKKLVGNDMQTSQLIGMIRYLAWVNGVKITGQSPKIKSTADKVATGDFKSLIESEPSKHDDAHDIDAIRHMAYWHFKQQAKEGTLGK